MPLFRCFIGLIIRGGSGYFRQSAKIVYCPCKYFAYNGGAIDERMMCMKEEWKSVLHSTWLKVVLVAIIIIPMCYAGIFLGSMWDPYGNSGAIPVAVVNNDHDVEYNGKTLDVGKELVSNLLENDAMKFQEVDAVSAEKGLEDGTYYMIITIPNNFSEHATTLLDENPKKMELQYTTNPGTNYIATKMDDSAMAKIRDSVSETVTKTYAETLFAQIQEVSSGLKEASDGSGQLADGAATAKNGSETIASNLNVLASSTLTFEDGANTLVKGLQEYTDGVDRVHDGAAQLNSGVQTMAESSTALVSGVDALHTGSNALTQGVKSYTDALSQLNAGSNQIASNNAALNLGMQQLAQGTTSLHKGSTAVLQGLTTLSNTIGTNLDENAEKVKYLQTQNNTTAQAVKELAQQAQALQTNIQLLSQNQQAQIEKLQAIKANPALSDAEKASLEEVIQSMQATPYAQLQEVLAQLSTQSGDMSTLLQADYATIHQFTQSLAQIQTSLTMHGGSADTTGLIAGMTSIEQGLASMDTSLNQQNGLVASVQQYTASVGFVADNLTTLNSKSTDLIAGSTQLSTGLGQLNNQVPALVNGVGQLQEGTSSLLAGTNQLTVNNPTLVNGASALADGSTQIHDGASLLAQGSTTLVNGLSQLQDGSGTLQTSLADGANKSNLQVSDKTNEMMANPVTLNHTEISSVENNGHAMAPYMMSVGLYVACMAFTLMYPLLKNNCKTKSGFKMWLSKAGVMYIVSTLMGISMIAALMLINGLQPYQVGMTMLIACLVAAAFMSMIVFLSITCGKIGSFIVLIFMVLQLGGAAGTYPIETSPSFYNTIHPFMPFSYSVEAFRHTLAMGGDITTDILVFAGMIVVFSILSILFYRWKVSISEEQYEQTLLSKFH